MQAFVHFFFSDFLRHFAVNPLLTIPLLFVACIVLLRLGDGFGLDWLFWEERRIFNGMFIAALYGTVLLVGFLLASDREIIAPDAQPFADMLSYWAQMSTILFVMGFAILMVGRLRNKKPLPQNDGTLPRAREQDRGLEPLRIEQYLLLVSFVLTVAVMFGIVVFLTECADPWIAAHPPHRMAQMFFWIRRWADLPPLPDSFAFLHLLALLVMALHVTYWAIYWTNPRMKSGSYATPASSLCSLLSMICMGGGMLQFYHLPLWLVAAGGLGLACWTAARQGPFTYRIYGFDYAKAPVKLSMVEVIDPPFEDPVISSSLKETGHAFAAEGGKRPLAIVCCSGGGIRAGVWAIRTLTQISEHVPGFKDRLRLIFGASGGMLGVTRFVTASPGTSNEDLVAQVESPALSDLTLHMIFHDFPHLFMPWAFGKHRGDVIENNWCHNFGWKEQMNLGHLKADQLAGRAPAVVYSPMMVEDGRRCLISNLNLGPLMRYDGPELKDFQGMKQPPHPRSFQTRSAVQLRDLFGSDAVEKLRLLSAVRLNASFPYVMPISSIPTQPRRRLVDAGYYDNYGVNLAADWLQFTMDNPERREWFKENVSGVVVIQIRDGILELTRPMAESEESNPPAIARAFEDLSGPVQAILDFKDSVQLFDNDARLTHVLNRLNREFGQAKCQPVAGESGIGDPSDCFATSIAFEFGMKASLSWALSKRDKANLLAESMSDEFQRRVKCLNAWWQRHELHQSSEPFTDGRGSPVAG